MGVEDVPAFGGIILREGLLGRDRIFITLARASREPSSSCAKIGARAIADN